MAYSEALGVAHEFAEKHGYEVDANQELNAHAGANLVSVLFGGMLAAGSMSASAVKDGVGARSQETNLVTWVVTIITLLLLTPLFAPLPPAVLRKEANRVRCLRYPAYRLSHAVTSSNTSSRSMRGSPCSGDLPTCCASSWK